MVFHSLINYQIFIFAQQQVIKENDEKIINTFYNPDGNSFNRTCRQTGEKRQPG